MAPTPSRHGAGHWTPGAVFTRLALASWRTPGWAWWPPLTFGTCALLCEARFFLRSAYQRFTHHLGYRHRLDPGDCGALIYPVGARRLTALGMFRRDHKQVTAIRFRDRTGVSAA